MKSYASWTRAGAGAACALLAGVGLVRGQDEPPVFGVASSVVKVDVVVRGEDGRPVRDLAAADFEVYEDGALQQLESFQVVALDLHPESPPAPAGALAEARQPSADGALAPVVPTPVAQPPALAEPIPSVIAFVFDRMAAAARDQAHRVAEGYARRAHRDGDVVGVFSIDQALHTLQPFTSNLELVEVAFAAYRDGGDTAFASTRPQARNRTAEQQRIEAQLRLLGSQSGSAMNATQMMALSIAANNARLQAEIARAFDALERDQQGLATTNALLAIVEGLEVIPGRKTLIFVSEGMALPASVLAQFQSVIAAANRAQVSVYTIDAGGLRVHSGIAETREELAQAGERRLFQESGGNTFAAQTPLSRAMERNEDFLRLDPHAGLGQLADETGGFLVRDTNDVAAGFRRIAEDMRFHYVLSYTPSNTDYDGRFREIAVRVRRPGATVQARKGYFAVPPNLSVPVRAYEAEALAQLERPEPPADFPFHAVALSFPEARRPGRVTVLASLPGTAVAYAPPGEDSPDFEADFRIVVRLRDAEGREVDRVSQRYLLSVPEGQLAAARGGDILFFEESDLPPGRYSVEAASYDATSGAASVRNTSLVVPPTASEPRPRLSSVVVVRSAEELPPEERRDGNPLVYGDVMLYPNLGEPLHKSASERMGFYFTAYDTDRYTLPVLTIDVLRGGAPLATVSRQLPAPDAQGRIQYAGTLPLAPLPEGELTLRVSVDDGAATASGETPFTVVQ